MQSSDAVVSQDELLDQHPFDRIGGIAGLSQTLDGGTPATFPGDTLEVLGFTGDLATTPVVTLAGEAVTPPPALGHGGLVGWQRQTSGPSVQAAIRQAEVDLGDRGRVLVRYSGTQSMCRVMVEGPTPEETARLAEAIAAAIRESVT